MLRTPLCDLLEIDVPVIQASIGPWTSVELSAAVSNAGGLGSLGAAVQPLERIREQIAQMRELTEAPFAVNHTLRPLPKRRSRSRSSSRLASSRWLSARPVTSSRAFTKRECSSCSRSTLSSRRARPRIREWM